MGRGAIIGDECAGTAIFATLGGGPIGIDEGMVIDDGMAGALPPIGTIVGAFSRFRHLARRF